MGLCMVSLFVVIMYILGAAKFGDLDKYGGVVSAVEVDDDVSALSEGEKKQVWFEGGMGEFLKVLPLTAWFFVGVESLSFACDETDQVSGGTSRTRGPATLLLNGDTSCIYFLACIVDSVRLYATQRLLGRGSGVKCMILLLL
jgi:amino acid permease